MVGLVVLLAFLAASAHAETVFISPPNSEIGENARNNPVYAEGEEIDVSWSTDLDDLILMVRQWYPATNDAPLTVYEGSAITSFEWTADLDDFDLDGIAEGEAAVFYFRIVDGSGTNTTADGLSHNFNVTLSAQTATTSSAPTSTTLSTSTSASTSTTPPEPPVPPPRPDPGLSTGAIIGIAIGAAVGAILLFAGVGFLLWRRYRARKQVPNQTSHNQMSPQPVQMAQAPTPTPRYSMAVHHSDPHDPYSAELDAAKYNPPRLPHQG
ncbi:hypothetical protein S40288_09692 [Stachybotrys chartarum IBT 40288]|nr:hypothetical protein S40288_09692 [Stachybotrys chartarum IBT 40288]